MSYQGAVTPNLGRITHAVEAPAESGIKTVALCGTEVLVRWYPVNKGDDLCKKCLKKMES